MCVSFYLKNQSYTTQRLALTTGAAEDWCVRICKYVLVTVWSGRNALWDRSPHLVLNYSSCQRASSPSPWKPLTKSFTPIPTDSSLHPLPGPHFLISLSHYLLPDLFIPLTPHSTSSPPSSFFLFICLSSTPFIQSICLAH